TGKGGTGKTSCAANVAGLAAQAGMKVLLIDLDSQGNLEFDLGYVDKGDEGKHLVSTLLTDGVLEPVLKNVRPNLDVIPGGGKLD
ncbi:AAA family ATPase, partial [Klebsiella pneumoniae]|nr:AAA family ATPase [Klebsiella pneumoniae]